MNRKALHDASRIVLDLGTSIAASILALLMLRAVYGEIWLFNRLFTMWILLSIPSAAAGVIASGTYRVDIRHFSFKSVNRLFYATLCKGALMAVFYLCRVYSAVQIDAAGFFWPLLCADMMFSLLLQILLRLFIITGYDVLSVDYAREVRKLSLLVCGLSDKSVAMVSGLLRSSIYKVEGFITMDSNRAGTIVCGLPVYYCGDAPALADLRNRVGFECILFTDYNPATEAEKKELSLMCIHDGIHVLTTPNVEVARLGTIPGSALMAVNNNEVIVDGMTHFGNVMKRIVDCLLAALLLVVFSPLMLLCALAILIEDGAPVFYKQERIGYMGRPFNIVKFRSMRKDAEAAGPALCSGKEDPRLTKVGAFLRAHHLDELPQLWNVFVGDMSFIGWRPERQFYIDKIMEHDTRYIYLYQIRPGVTSYATLKNGYTDTMEKMLLRLEYDLYYLRHRSWFFDMKILAQTFMSIVFGKKF